MSFVGRSEAERRVMLQRIGAPSLEALWEAIPSEFRVRGSLPVDPPLAEYEIARRFAQWAESNADAQHYACFLGAGIYDHFIPAALRSLLSRSEFATAYTPYQPEVSQGTLQTIFEYQSMICELTGMEVANASLYDGATACAEAAHLAVGATGRRIVLVSEGVHPHYREVVRTYAAAGSFEARDVPLERGTTSALGLKRMLDSSIAAVLWAQPNFEGIVEDGSALTDAAHAAGAYSIAAADPVALAVLKPPGADGADIVVGEGQPLGVAMGYGGPLVGFFSVRRSDVRRLPGRLAGVTVDLDGRRGFVLTLQTREQHIRRDKATSNICTNVALCALMATIYLATLGKGGLVKVGELSAAKAHYAADRLTSVPGVSLRFEAPFFKEFALRLPRSPERVAARLARSKILA
ncbi:MAG TPA: aminomethyl-transferring glycine dehydrogenase subunit GcvPA, partial [Candidatus Eisenbacteria bacterium]